MKTVLMFIADTYGYETRGKGQGDEPRPPCVRGYLQQQV